MGWLWHDDGCKGTIILWVCRMYFKIFYEPCLAYYFPIKCRSISKLFLFGGPFNPSWKNILDALILMIERKGVEKYPFLPLRNSSSLDSSKDSNARHNRVFSPCLHPWHGSLFSSLYRYCSERGSQKNTCVLFYTHFLFVEKRKIVDKTLEN